MIGLLTHLSTALGRSEAESAALLNAFVREVHQTVRTHGEATYPGLGSFRLGPAGMLEFRPDASLALVVNHRFAGLTPVPVQASPAPTAAAPPNPAAATSTATPAGWMPPTAPLVPPTDAGFGPMPGSATGFGNAPTYGNPPGFEATTPFPPPADLPPIGAYTSNPIVEPPGGYGYVPPASSAYTTPTYPPPGGTYVPPVVLPVTPTTTYTESAFPLPEEPVTVRPHTAAPRRPSFALITIGLLALLGLLAWYLWATAPQRGLPTAGTPPPATIVAPNAPDFSLPPPDSMPPESGLAADSAVPAPTTPATPDTVDPGASVPPAVDPGASASDPAPETKASPSAPSAPTASATPSTPPHSTPTVRPSASPYTPYTGSSRPDRTVRRSPPRRPYTGRTYRSSGGSSRRPAPTTRSAAPPPSVATAPAPRPTPRPAAPAPETAYAVGLTPELETMLLDEAAVQPGEGWTIVVRGEPTEDAARIVAERYRTVGYRVNVFEGLTADGRTVFRVVVGQFPTARDAQRALRTLAGDAFPADAWMLPLATDQ